MTYPLFISEPPIQVLPVLAGAVGFTEAAVLQDIHYCLSSQGDTLFREERYWVANLSDRLLQRFFFLDVETIGYIIAQLEQSGILVVFKESNAITYHAINYDRLEELAPTDFVFTPFVQDTLPSQKATPNTRPSFTVDVQHQGNTVYVMTIQDPRHFLDCELVLDIQSTASTRNVICHFPRIVDEHFEEFVWDDAMLYEILMTVFRMKILKQLLLFCIKHQASNLIIFTDDVQSEDLEIYHEFLIRQNRPTPDREKPEMIIPADQETFDAWIDFMETTLIKLRQTLWRDQKTNAAIAHYLRFYEGTLL